MGFAFIPRQGKIDESIALFIGLLKLLYCSFADKKNTGNNILRKSTFLGKESTSPVKVVICLFLNMVDSF